MTDFALVPVTFDVGGQRFEGEAGRQQIVHQALEHILPREYLVAQQLTEGRSDGTLIYPDMFVGEIFDHYGDAQLVVEVTPLNEAFGDWTNYGFDHLALATNSRTAARLFPPWLKNADRAYRRSSYGGDDPASYL